MENLDFYVEVYYLSRTEKILFKFFKVDPDFSRVSKDFINSKSLQYYNMLNNGDLFCYLTLNFDDIFHPDGLLDDDQISKLISHIIVHKLLFDNCFWISVFSRNELGQILQDTKLDKKIP
jgi:hypothetical protein